MMHFFVFLKEKAAYKWVILKRSSYDDEVSEEIKIHFRRSVNKFKKEE